MNIGKYFQRLYSLAHLPPAPQVSANLTQETPFYFRFQVLGTKIYFMARYLISKIFHKSNYAL